MQTADVQGEGSETRQSRVYLRSLPSLGGAFALLCLSVYLSRQISELAAAASGGGGSESSGCSVLITKYTGEPGGAPGAGASREKGLLPSASGTCTGAPHSWSALSRVQERTGLHPWLHQRRLGAHGIR